MGQFSLVNTRVVTGGNAAGHHAPVRGVALAIQHLQHVFERALVVSKRDHFHHGRHKGDQHLAVVLLRQHALNQGRQDLLVAAQLGPQLHLHLPQLRKSQILQQMGPNAQHPVVNGLKDERELGRALSTQLLKALQTNLNICSFLQHARISLHQGQHTRPVLRLGQQFGADRKTQLSQKHARHVFAMLAKRVRRAHVCQVEHVGAPIFVIRCQLGGEICPQHLDEERPAQHLGQPHGENGKRAGKIKRRLSRDGLHKLVDNVQPQEKRSVKGVQEMRPLSRRLVIANKPCQIGVALHLSQQEQHRPHRALVGHLGPAAGHLRHRLAQLVHRLNVARQILLRQTRHPALAHHRRPGQRPENGPLVAQRLLGRTRQHGPRRLGPATRLAPEAAQRRKTHSHGHPHHGRRQTPSLQPRVEPKARQTPFLHVVRHVAKLAPTPPKSAHKGRRTAGLVEKSRLQGARDQNFFFLFLLSLFQNTAHHRLLQLWRAKSR